MTWESNQFDTIRCQLSDIEQKLDAVLRREHFIIENQEKIMSAVDDLATSVAAEDTTIDGAVALIQGLSAALAAAGTDPAKLAALKSDIDAKTAALAAAVVANTPAPSSSAPVVTPAQATQAATAAVAAA